MKKLYAFLILTLLALPLAAAPVFANHGGCKHGQCSLRKSGCDHGDCGKASGGCPLVEMFMKKAHFFVDHQKALGLSDEQVNKIKTLKMERKKAIIRQTADHQIFMVDVTMKLHETPLDVEGLNAMIDQATASMATAAKETVAALVELKGVLSEEQMATAKGIWGKHKH